MRFVILAMLLIAAGCGKDEGGGNGDATDDTPDKGGNPAGTPTHNAMLVPDAASLPACDAASEGWIIYVKAETKLVACEAGAWADAPLAPSPAADPTTIVDKQWLCGTSADIDPDADITLKGYGATVVKFKSGDVFMSCTASLFFEGSGELAAAADTMFFSATSGPTTKGVFLCDSPYVSAEFTLATAKIKYASQASNDSKTKECELLP